MRIIPEWTSYDQEVRTLQDRLEAADVGKPSSAETTEAPGKFDWRSRQLIGDVVLLSDHAFHRLDRTLLCSLIMLLLSLNLGYTLSAWCSEFLPLWLCNVLVSSCTWKVRECIVKSCRVFMRNMLCCHVVFGVGCIVCLTIQSLRHAEVCFSISTSCLWHVLCLLHMLLRAASSHHSHDEFWDSSWQLISCFPLDGGKRQPDFTGEFKPMCRLSRCTWVWRAKVLLFVHINTIVWCSVWYWLSLPFLCSLLSIVFIFFCCT